MLEPTCFVCDETTTGECTNLASAVAPVSKVGLAEKISQVIGERFVVIITEKDVVCKRCVSLLVHMDKLENEFMLVKKALLGYIKRRYNLPIEDGSVKTEKKIEANSEEEREINPTPTTRTLTDVSAQNNSGSITLSGLKNISARSKETKVKQPVPDTNLASRMKVYKCGFCSFQSKELNDVRIHMKQHVKANNKIDEPTPIPKPVNSLGTPPPKRRLFRCQLCSVSFDEKIKCLEHISRVHTQTRKPAAETSILQKAVEKELGNKKQPMEKDSTSAMETDLNRASENPFGSSMMECDDSNTAVGPVGSAVANNSDNTAVTKEEEVSDDKKTMQPIDIEAMIASLNSDGPADSTV